MTSRDVTQLAVQDLETHPVWAFTEDEGVGECRVRPVRVVPTEGLGGKLIGTRLSLANGERVWAMVSNVDAADARWNDHFLTLSFACSGRWFPLARYHDVDYAERGPDALARFLGLTTHDIFPIAYDLTPVAVGSRAALVGVVSREPRERLTREALIAMAVRGTDGT